MPVVCGTRHTYAAEADGPQSGGRDEWESIIPDRQLTRDEAMEFGKRLAGGEIRTNMEMYCVNKYLKGSEWQRQHAAELWQLLAPATVLP